MGYKKRQKRMEKDIAVSAFIYLGVELAKALSPSLKNALANPPIVKRHAPDPAPESDWQDPEVIESTVKKS